MIGVTCFWFSLMICCAMRIQCTEIFVASTVYPVINIDEDFGRKLFHGSSNQESRGGSQWRDLTNNRRNRMLFEQSRDFGGDSTVPFSMDKCFRYCIGGVDNKNDDNIRYINLLWTANDSDALEQHFTKNHLRVLPKVQRKHAPNFHTVPKNCQIYLDLDCNVGGSFATNYTDRGSHLNAENIKTYENHFDRFSETHSEIPKKLVEKHDLSEETETKFLVNTIVSRIIFNVDGNISSVLLRIPMEASASQTGTGISWSRKNNGNGVRIDATNAPPGEWCLKLLGVDHSKYHITAEGYAEAENSGSNLFLPNHPNNENFYGMRIQNRRSATEPMDDASVDNKKSPIGRAKPTNSELITFEERNLHSLMNPALVENVKIIHGRSLEHRSRDDKESVQQMEENFNDNDSSTISSNTENELTKLVEYVTNAGNGADSRASLNVSSRRFSNRMFSIEPRSSVGIFENLDADARIGLENGVNVSMRMIESLDNREASEELQSYSNENNVEGKRMLIELNRNSNLLVTPGTIHRIVFDVKNSCILPVRYTFRVKSSPFRVYNIQPVYAWIYPGQMSKVAVDLVVPDNAAPDTVNTVTLSIVGTEIKEKSVYLYVQGSLSKLTDDVKPTIEHSYNNNCAGKMEKDRCYKSRWSADITIQDYDSGLKQVVSSPNDVFPRTEFISGTRSPITFYYSSTCCDKTAKITAIDLLDNYNTYTIDVSAWNNLSQAEVAAITVGAFLALLLIILIIILILYCVRRKKSHDLPYTQRYGSRPPAHSERTNL